MLARWKMKKDPPMKRVRRGEYECALETCDNPLNEVTIKNQDPFCSTGCCHEWHGVEIQTNPTLRGPTVASSS